MSFRIKIEDESKPKKVHVAELKITATTSRLALVIDGKEVIQIWDDGDLFVYENPVYNMCNKIVSWKDTLEE